MYLPTGIAKWGGRRSGGVAMGAYGGGNRGKMRRRKGKRRRGGMGASEVSADRASSGLSTGMVLGRWGWAWEKIERRFMLGDASTWWVGKRGKERSCEGGASGGEESMVGWVRVCSMRGAG